MMRSLGSKISLCSAILIGLVFFLIGLTINFPNKSTYKSTDYVVQTVESKLEKTKQLVVMEQTNQPLVKATTQIEDHSTKRNSERSCIYFNHFPKTAGTSILTFLRDVSDHLNYSMFYWYDWNPPNLNGFYNESWPRLKLTYNNNAIHTGHKIPIIFRRLAKLENCYMFTVLREPVDRMVSLFFYKREWWKDWDDFIEKTAKPDPNKTSKFLLSTHNSLGGCVQDECSCSINPDWNMKDHRELLCKVDVDFSPPINMSRAVEIAKKFLLQHDLVCFMDDLNACARELNRIIGHPELAAEIKHLNIGKLRKNVPVSEEVDLSRIKDTYIEFDIELYKWAREHFFG